MKMLWGGGGLRKFLDTRKGGSEKIRVRGALKICILQNQQQGGGEGGGGGDS